MESDVRTLHALVMRRSAPDIAGQYADHARYINTDRGAYHFPTPAEVPALMGAFAAWLAAASVTPETAFTAHRRLVTIHPFNDGNGRAGRLLMNLLLIRGGYPPVPIRPVDRLAYLRGLEASQAREGHDAFEHLLYERLDATLTVYLRAAREALQR